jgi:hypothetical protein
VARLQAGHVRRHLHRERMVEQMTPSDDPVVARVLDVVERAAELALASGQAQLTVSSVGKLYGAGPDDDNPAIVLTPRRRDAARVVIEVHGDEDWWVTAGDGPGTELYAGIERQHGDRYALLEALVRAVVDGRFRHGPCSKEFPRLFRAPRVMRGWCETFDTDDGPFTSRHFGPEPPPHERTFAAYT